MKLKVSVALILHALLITAQVLTYASSIVPVKWQYAVS